jgi:hypothetical protein
VSRIDPLARAASAIRVRADELDDFAPPTPSVLAVGAGRVRTFSFPDGTSLVTTLGEKSGMTETITPSVGLSNRRGSMQREQQTDRIAQLRRLAAEIVQLPSTRARLLLLGEVRSGSFRLMRSCEPIRLGCKRTRGPQRGRMSDHEELAHALRRVR